jgi:hypothetical protein
MDYGKDNCQINTANRYTIQGIPKSPAAEGENVSERRVNNYINRFTMFETARTSSSRNGCGVGNSSHRRHKGPDVYLKKRNF